MKPLATRLLICLFLLVPFTAWAGETVTLDTIATNLLPGTKARVEIGAEYRMYELPKRPAGSTDRVLRVPVTEDMTRYRAASNNRGLWQFTIAPDGSLPTPQMELRFAKDFPKPIQGMRSKLYFNMKYTLDLPARNGDPARTVRREIETTLRLPEEGMPLTACLRLEQVGDGLFVGVTPACDTPLVRSRLGGGK